jgi:membrane-associated phospholipid phosphatase
MSRQNTIALLLTGYLAIVVVLMLYRNVSITPDRLFVFLLFAAIIAGRLKSFLRDWLPFVALILAYEMLRGFADSHFPVHVASLVNAERALFSGNLPTEVLQNLLYKEGAIGWKDVGATIIYFLHFPLPLIFAFFLWVKDKQQYYQFVIALIALSFSGFITFLLFPAAPPWYAADEGLISVTKITNLAVDHVGWSWNLSYYYSHLNPNPVAAMPSLHAAYPTLVWLALRRYNKRLSWFFLPYPPLVWLSTIYLGEHYVIDVIAGAAYAFAAYFVVYDFATVRRLAARFAAAASLGQRSQPCPSPLHNRRVRAGRPHEGPDGYTAQAGNYLGSGVIHGGALGASRARRQAPDP